MESATVVQDSILHYFDTTSELPTYLIIKHETTEISALFATLGALCVALTIGLAIGLAILWNPLP